MTVLLSSHLLAEVEELCNRVAIVRTGRIVYEGALAELKRTAGVGYRLRTTDDERALAVCRRAAGHRRASRVADGEIALHAPTRRPWPQLSVALVEAGALILELTPQTATLEDLFFQLTEGDGARPSAGEPGAARRRRDARRAHRLPLGAAQAALPEAHVPRPRRRGRWCRSSSSIAVAPAAAAGPSDVAFGRYIHDTGLAIPLVLLLFGSIWLFPLITALVAGDIVASEDHNGTLKTILTRSVERGQVFAGKALAAVTYAVAAIVARRASSRSSPGIARVRLQPAHEPVRHDASRRRRGARARSAPACSST